MPRKLYPNAEEISEVYSDITFPGCSPVDDELPYAFINMVSSLDGKASASGKSGAIGSSEDRTAMRVLRSKADAVMSGSGTLRAEKVSLTSEGRRSPEPLAVIPSVSMGLPLSRNLLHAVPERTLILTTERAISEHPRETEEISKSVKVVTCAETKDHSLDYKSALQILRSRYGVSNLLVEGGPGLNHRLLTSSTTLIQELFVTLAPKILGGAREDSHSIVEGPLIDPDIEADLLSLYISENGETFLRYSLRP